MIYRKLINYYNCYLCFEKLLLFFDNNFLKTTYPSLQVLSLQQKGLKNESVSNDAEVIVKIAADFFMVFFVSDWRKQQKS